MDERTEERIGAASGIAMVIIGAVAELFERAPETAADFVTHRAAVLTQGMVFLLGSAVALWFLAALRGYLLRYEGGGGRLSSLVLAAGVAWVSVNLIAQAFQIGLADDPSGGAPFALIRIAMAIFTIANLPLAVSLVAVAVVSLRYHAFPAWLAWLGLGAAVAQALLWLSTVLDSGPLAPNGWLSFVLYPFFLIWLVPTSVVMMRRAGASIPGQLPGRLPASSVS